MKRSVFSQLTLVILFLLQSQQLYTKSVQAIEYSEQRIYIVESYVGEHALTNAGDQQQEYRQHHNEGNQFKTQHQQQLNQRHLHQQHQNLHQIQQQHQNHPPVSTPMQPKQPPQQGLQQQHHQPHTYNDYQQAQLQQNHQHYEEQHYQHHHHSIANSMQQVLFDTAGRYRIAQAQFEYKQESTPDGVLEEFYMDGYESYPMTSQDQVPYYQYQFLHHHYHHKGHHSMHARQINDDHDLDLYNSPRKSCEPHNPSILMPPNRYEPTCRAPTMDKPTASDPSRNVPNFSHLTNKPSHNSNVESYPLVPRQHYQSSLMSAICHYWREVSGLCLASAVFLNWLFVVIKRRFVASGLTSSIDIAAESIHQPATRSNSKDTNSSSAQDSAFEETASPISTEDIDNSKSSSDLREKSTYNAQVLNTTGAIRQRSSTLKSEQIVLSTSPCRNSLSTSLSNSLNTSEYNSRYSSDFESIQRLGRGGFGIVFEAKNKIDDCHYAVKRICLPLEKEARERVMREVRALAKLDHAGIVRYYNAWLETPPDEWLKQHDAQLGIVHLRDGVSFPSTDGIYERNETEQITKADSSGKLSESGDNLSGLFGSSPFKRRGYRRFLKKNSSSPSLDIVFEGSGSIRLESENNTEKTCSSQGEENEDVNDNSKNIIKGCKIGDNIISDSEDSDFIQFESRGNRKGIKDKNEIDGELSISSHFTEPFSSSSNDSSKSSDDKVVENNCPRKDKVSKPVNMVERKNALNYQRELRQLNNASLMDNLHFEKVYLYIQMQLCRKDTLKDWLKTNCENRDKTNIFDLFYQIVDAVEYVHSQDLIHRDLKPSNIFFSLDGTLKIGDFGLCRTKTNAGIGSSLDLQEYVAESDVERGFEAVHTEQVGTQLYMSPEQLNGLSYNQKVDIFAMGLILLELLVPFKTQMQRVNVLFKARNNLYSGEFQSEHPREYELVKSLLSRSPQKRPTATEIKQHELLASAQLSQPVIERIYHRRRTISSNSSTE